MANIPILWKRDPWVEHLGKLIEEFTELCHELHDIQTGVGDIERVASEAMDVIQVAIGIIDATGADPLKVMQDHASKLTGRGWSIKGWIDVDITKCRG